MTLSKMSSEFVFVGNDLQHVSGNPPHAVSSVHCYVLDGNLCDYPRNVASQLGAVKVHSAAYAQLLLGLPS